MLTGMGLALGVDYSLFIVSRFREERARGVEKIDAIEATGRTASRAVLFSGTAFVIALSGMLLVPDTILRSLALGAVLVGVTRWRRRRRCCRRCCRCWATGSTRSGCRSSAAARPGKAASGARVVSRVQRRPWSASSSAVALLVALALPALDLRTGSAGVRTVPDGYPSKDGFNALEREFGVGTVDSAQVVAEGDVDAARGARRRSRTLVQLLSNDPAFRAPEASTSPDGELAIVEAQVRGDSRDESAVQAVERLRAEVVPTAMAGDRPGRLRHRRDRRDRRLPRDAEDWLPLVFLYVLGFSFVLLTIAFRSLVVPAKAIVLNLLSVGAAYGLIVLVFQKGVGNELFGFPQVDAIEAWLPLFLFSVLFGLSMDYHVFLLSRIRERYTQTGDTSEAVAFGVGRPRA